MVKALFDTNNLAPICGDAPIQLSTGTVIPMSAAHFDWLKAAGRRSYRTIDATEVVTDAVERAEMNPEHAALDELLK
jgi:hypothetical protein